MQIFEGFFDKNGVKEGNDSIFRTGSNSFISRKCLEIVSIKAR